MSLKIAFRVDSSPGIGIGHIMRCLTLAETLRDSGAECLFVCRNHAGNSSHLARERGFGVELLETGSAVRSESWLGVTQAVDADQTCAVLENEAADWLVVDHYAIDAEWETAVRKRFPDLKLMVIDDRVNRPHDCHLLLDQTAGRQAGDYRGLVKSETCILAGTDHAMLRSRFRELREQKAFASQQPETTVFVFLGGGENGSVLERVLGGLEAVARKHPIAVSVVAGADHARLKQGRETSGYRLELLGFAGDVAERMAHATINIGACGTATWERCCLGAASVVMSLADNQEEIFSILDREQAALCVPPVDTAICEAVEKLVTDQELRQRISGNAARLCDGRGAQRVAHQLLSMSIVMRRADEDDARFIHEARYAGDASRYYRNSAIPSFDEHVGWYRKALGDDDRIFLIAELAGEAVGQVRFDRFADRPDHAEIGIAVHETWRGRKIGTPMLEAAMKSALHSGISTIHAEVHPENRASARMFEKAGFKPVKSADANMLRFEWHSAG